MMLYVVHGNAEIHMCTNLAYMHCFRNEEVVETMFKMFTKL